MQINLCAQVTKKKPWLAPQILKVMKLTVILMTIACLQVSARAFSQITLAGKNMELSTVFSTIQKQSGYTFFYKDKIVENTTVSIDLHNASLDEAMKQTLEGLPLTYNIVDKTVVIKKKEPTILDKLRNALAPSPSDEVKGYVLNKANEPLIGASVRIKRTGLGSVCDETGSFYLKNVISGDTLVVSYIGYATQKIRYTSEQGFSHYIYLQEATNPLDQVVIQAYGETSQRLSTGDIGTISAKDIEKQPVMNPLLALQGRIAGVDVQQTSGYASGPVSVIIRGLTAVDKSWTEPLYVIDGVPLTTVQVGGGINKLGVLQSGLPGPAQGQSALFSIDPSTIESISVLKDAEATSIYGSRGANGVILITTKKGKAGKAEFNADVQHGFSKVTRYWQMLNTAQYLSMREEAFHNDGITPTVANAPDLMLWSQNRYTDWQKVLWGKTASSTNAQLSLSGGSNNVSFRIGAGYSRADEITAIGGDQRMDVSFNITYHSLNNKLTVGLSGQYGYTQSDMIQIPNATKLAPNAPPIFNSDGSLDWADWLPTGNGNPFYTLFQPYTAKTSLLAVNLPVSYQFLRGLKFTTSFGYNISHADQVYLTPISSQDPAGNPTGGSSFGYNTNQNWIIEPQLSYDAGIWKGKLSVLIGGSAQRNITDGTIVTGGGYTNDALLRTVSNAPIKDANDNFGEYRYASIFGRIGYNIADKYIADFTSRRDGSSNYGSGNQYGSFAAVGAAWLFTNEEWFKTHLKFLSFGKLRGSFGTSGSDGGVPYAYLTRWSSNGLYPYNGIQPLDPTQHANPNYHWQIDHKKELGLNLGFFKDWITVSAVRYDRRTDNQLLNYPTPQLSGFATVLENLPAIVENKGWEFTIGGKGINTDYFQWAPSFNFTINQNKFVSFAGLGGTGYYKNGVVGQPLNVVYVLHYTGVDPQTGQYTFQDVNHDGIIQQKPVSQGGDEYPKKISPTFFTGFGFNSGFKGFKLSLQFVIKKQNGINALGQGLEPGGFSATTGNQPVAVLARWQYPGQITNTGKFSTIKAFDPNTYLSDSDIGYTDASYFRIQTASLSYTLSESIAKKLGVKSFSVFVHTNDLLTITGYKGIDPETQSFGGMPPVKTIMAGLSAKF